jgi:ribosomal protein S18 acetylase RimI-like enzyme
VDRLSLAPMSADRFAHWAEHSRRGFVDQQVRSGALPPVEADAYATEQLTALLPEGRSTDGHHFWTVLAAGEEVGTLWLRVRGDGPDREGYLFDVEVLPGLRGRGLGRATMLAAEDAARGLGARWLRLNVFGHNTPAIRLYDGLGYGTVAAVLAAHLDGTGELPDDGPPEVRLSVRSDAPDDETWVAERDGLEVGALRMCAQRRSSGLHLDGRDFFVTRTGVAPAVVAAVERLAGDRGAVSLALSATEPALRHACEQRGYVLTAQLMEKRL